MSAIAALRELHATIGAALDDIDRVYTREGLAYPSLDVPSYTHADGKKPAAEELAVSPEVANASALVVAACNRLAASVNNPVFTLFQGISAGYLTAALAFLEASDTVEILREAGPQGLHAQDLARRIDEVILGKEAATRSDVSHCDPVKLSHVLRLLATHHWLTEVAPDVYANNRLSSFVDTGKKTEDLASAPEKKYEDTNGSSAAFLGMWYAILLVSQIPHCASSSPNGAPNSSNEMFRSVTALSEWLMPSKDRAAPPPTPFNIAYNTDLNHYAWLELPENASKLARCGRAMGIGAWTEGQLGMADKAVFPWDTLPEGSAVVDVGGGIGSVAVQVAAAHPHLRVIVQDREQTIGIARKVWGTKHQDLFESGRVTFQAQDFFEPQPKALTVPGVGQVAHPAVYIVTRVIHNWPDAECVKILSRLRAAAGPDSKLIIHEVILPLACTQPERQADSELARAIKDTTPTPFSVPPPLLLPYSSSADIMMMAVLNSRERTLRELSDLARQAGWRIESIARSDSPMAWGYMTAVPI
ncbi:S-adenosyl-L-methionine-dependent methyltransferase [Trametes polyzona]|nr:S-adenosyl-L-methionine-dependent methyltransferase [Trametes polyzona]